METTGCEREVKRSYLLSRLRFCLWLHHIKCIYWMKITSNVIVIVINSIDCFFFFIIYSIVCTKKMVNLRRNNSSLLDRECALKCHVSRWLYYFCSNWMLFLSDSEPAVQDPQVQLWILGLHLKLWTGGGVLHGSAGVQQLCTSDCTYLQGWLDISLCTAWHRGPNEPAQLLQGRTDFPSTYPDAASSSTPAGYDWQPRTIRWPGSVPLWAQSSTQHGAT